MPQRCSWRQSKVGTSGTLFNRNVFRRRAVENLPRHLSDASSGCVTPAHHAADDTRAEVQIGDAVDRDGGGLGQCPCDLVRIDDRLGVCWRVASVENQAWRGYRLDGGKEARQRLLVDVGELCPAPKTC